MGHGGSFHFSGGASYRFPIFPCTEGKGFHAEDAEGNREARREDGGCDVLFSASSAPPRSSA
jgi:hypothetical protein